MNPKAYMWRWSETRNGLSCHNFNLCTIQRIKQQNVLIYIESEFQLPS